MENSMAEEFDDTDAESQSKNDLELQIQAAEEHRRDLESQGWVWRGDGIGKVLAHPDDPDLNCWFHPYTGEQLLSPKLVERLRSQIDRIKLNANETDPVAEGES